MYSLILVTCPRGAAERIATRLLERRLAACVSAIGGVTSRYWWDGKLETASESLLLIKTRAELFRDVEREVKSIHPYEVPEIVEVKLGRGSRPYLDWMARETGAKATRGEV